MGKPFQPVERLPVPEEVAGAFKKLRSATMGNNLSGYGGDRAKAAAKLTEAETNAASHFGGDVGKMSTHFKRWTRWGGHAMGAADFILPRESYEEGMDKVDEVMRGPMRKIPTRIKQA